MRRRMTRSGEELKIESIEITVSGHDDDAMKAKGHQ